MTIRIISNSIGLSFNGNSVVLTNEATGSEVTFNGAVLTPLEILPGQSINYNGDTYTNESGYSQFISINPINFNRTCKPYEEFEYNNDHDDGSDSFGLVGEDIGSINAIVVEAS